MNTLNYLFNILCSWFSLQYKTKKTVLFFQIELAKEAGKSPSTVELRGYYDFVLQVCYHLNRAE